MSDDQIIDPQIREVIGDEKRVARGVGREAAAKNRKLKRLATKALEAIAAKDARAYAKHLQEAGVVDGSDEWKRAWIVFRKASAGS
jgi:hypothetical protein